MSTKNTSRFMPLIIAISVVAGILIGTFMPGILPVTNWESSIARPTS